MMEITKNINQYIFSVFLKIMCTCFHWMYVYAPHCALGFQRPERPERPSDALEVELQMSVGHHVRAELINDMQ